MLDKIVPVIVITSTQLISSYALAKQAHIQEFKKTEQVQCQYSGQSYSLGGTVCECPSYKGDGGLASGGSGHLISRRLTCGKDGGWTSDGSTCLDVDYRYSTAAHEDYDKYADRFCPKALVSREDIEKATTQDNGNFYMQASKPAVMIAVKAICIRFSIGASCDALIGAIGASSLGVAK